MVDGLEFFNALAESARKNEGLKSQFPDLEKQLKEILSSLKEVTGRFKDQYAIKSSETAMETLRRFMVDSMIQAKEQDARNKALYDMAEAMVPQVTDAQMQAYAAQKQAYEDHQKQLKAQTDAIVKAATAQTKAIQEEADAQIKIADKEAAKRTEAVDRQLENEKARESQIASALGRPLDAGSDLSKIGGRETLVTQALAGLKGALAERKAQDDKAIAEAFAPQAEAIQKELEARKEAIQEEADARKKAIEEEKEAQIAATKEAMEAIAKASGIVKPEDPRKLRDAQVARIAQEASGLKGIESAAPGAIAAEVAQIAGGAKEAPQAASLLSQPSKPSAASALQSTVSNAATTPSPKGGAAGASAGPAAASNPEGLAGPAAVSELGGITKAVGTLSATVGKFQPLLAPVVQILSDIDNTLPVISTGIGAIADASRVLGPTIFSVIMDLGGYLVEAINGATDTVVEAFTVGNTRREELEETGVLAAERAKVQAARDAELTSYSQAASAGLSTNLSGVTGSVGRARGTLQKVETPLTTPAAEQAGQAGTVSQGAQAQSAAALQQATQQMVEAQERAFRKQAQVGLGTTPLIMSTPHLEPFPA